MLFLSPSGGVTTSSGMKTKSKKSESAAKLKRGRPPKISRDDIISASLRSKSELTLKSVADDLRVTPQALYRYVSGIGDIMEMAADKLRQEFPFQQDKGQDWFSFAYEMAHVLRRLYLAIPGLAEYAMNSPMQIPAVLSGYEKSMVIARRTGFDEINSYWATQAYIEFVYTWVAREQRREAMTAASGRSAVDILLERLSKPDVRLPLLEQVLPLAERMPIDDRFDLRLRWLLAGIAHGNGLQITLPPRPRAPAKGSPRSIKKR